MPRWDVFVSCLVFVWYIVRLLASLGYFYLFHFFLFVKCLQSFPRKIEQGRRHSLSIARVRQVNCWLGLRFCHCGIASWIILLSVFLCSDMVLLVQFMVICCSVPISLCVHNGHFLSSLGIFSFLILSMGRLCVEILMLVIFRLRSFLSIRFRQFSKWYCFFMVQQTEYLPPEFRCSALFCSVVKKCLAFCTYTTEDQLI